MGNIEPNTIRETVQMRNRLLDLLTGYLLAMPGFLCPGMDGATVEDVVSSEYPSAAASGRVPRPVDLAARYPDLAGELSSFFHAEFKSVQLAS